MLDQTETVCILAGAAAIGAIYMAKSRPHMGATECSARAAPVVSARATAVAEPVSQTATHESDDALASAFPPLSDGFDMQFQGTQVPNRNMAAAARSRISLMTPPMPSFTKETGSVSLVPGRDGATAAPRPKPTGGCMFNMSEAYADAAQGA